MSADQPNQPAPLPRITVVTPSFNQASLLERAIRSVLDQAYPDLEYIVMDGGSTDGSADIVARYADRLDYWQSQPDGGQAAAIAAGWARGTGDVVAWLNSDDFYLPGALQFVGQAFAAAPELGLLYGSCQRVDADGRLLGYLGRPYSRLLMLASHDVIPQPSTFVRANLVRQAGGLNPALNYALDYDLFLRLAKLTRPRYDPRPLAAITIHPATKSSTGVRQMADERQTIRRREARGLERAIVALQPAGSRVYRMLPSAARGVVQALRPRRIHKAPVGAGGGSRRDR